MKKLIVLILCMIAVLAGIQLYGYLKEQYLLGKTVVEVEGQVNTKPSVETKVKEELPGGWKLVWHDEFDNTKSLQNWNVLDWGTPHNNELQYYSPKNVSIRDGNLIITAKKEKMGEKSYTSGAVTTLNKFNLKYGKVEIRAQLPGGGKGIFPAMWMRDVHKKKHSPELDFMEYIGNNPTQIYHAIHWYYQGVQYREDFATLQAKGIQEGYHTFGFEWYPDRVVFFIDGQETFQATRYSPNVEMYLYINLAIGGNWPGAPTNTVDFPREMKIDYVRVYKLK